METVNKISTYNMPLARRKVVGIKMKQERPIDVGKGATILSRCHLHGSRWLYQYLNSEPCSC
jgi:hypothetical protein